MQASKDFDLMITCGFSKIINNNIVIKFVIIQKKWLSEWVQFCSNEESILYFHACTKNLFTSH